MTRYRRPSAQTTAVVLALAEQPTTWRYGYQLCQQLHLQPGSLYRSWCGWPTGACWRPAGKPTSPPAGRLVICTG